MINVKNKVLIKAIGVKIKELRISQELTQEELANEADVPLSQVGRIERGENNPTISTLFVLAQALKIELRDLIDVKMKN